MNFISIKQNNLNTYSLISNQFLDQFLAHANEIQIKVYLFLLRCLSEGKSTDISSMADFFNYPEKDIVRALTYWEKKNILSLTIDSKETITEIQLLDFPSSKEEHIIKEKSPASAVSSSLAAAVKTDPSLPSDKKFHKPDYSLDQLAEFQSRESTSEILFIAESYLGKTLSASDIRSVLFISQELNFSVDLIDHLLQYCIDRGKKDFRYIEKVAINWAEHNITTPSQADSFSSKYQKDVYTVMNALGKNNTPTPKEAEYIKRWYQIYGFSSDVVLEACERTVLATDRHRFEYADKILSSWNKAGVHHKPDIDKIDAGFHAKQKKASPASKNSFNHFQQNEYDFERLEKELLSN